MARTCPHCGERIKHVMYSCKTLGWETGTLNDSGDYNCDGSGTDETEDCRYTCPECDHEVSRRSDWIEEEEEEEEEKVPSAWGELV